jgi:hypothetical protein
MKRRLNKIPINSKEDVDNIIYGVGIDNLNRFDVFYKHRPKFKGKFYWYALRVAWETTDNLYKYSDVIKYFFNNSEPHRDSIMTDEEKKYLDNLPERIKIYRGMTEVELMKKEFGCSWTLKKEVALFFANDNRRNYDTNHLKKVVHSLTINKKDVIAFLNGRQEYEIIYIKEK